MLPSVRLIAPVVPSQSLGDSGRALALLGEKGAAEDDWRSPRGGVRRGSHQRGPPHSRPPHLPQNLPATCSSGEDLTGIPLIGTSIGLSKCFDIV